jgi:hypothetical protein
VAPAVAEIYSVKDALPAAGTVGLLLTVTELDPEKLAVTPWPDGETDTPLVTIPVKVLAAGDVSVTVTTTLVATPSNTFVEAGETLTVNFFVEADATWGIATMVEKIRRARKFRSVVFIVILLG